MTQGDGAEDLEVRRWSRYGNDRLYVRRRGAQIGWWDLLADRGHPERPEYAEPLSHAVERWKRSRPAAEPPTAKPGTDLAWNQPGQAVHAQAEGVELQRMAIQWAPRPPRRSFWTWLTSGAADRKQHRESIELWRFFREEQRTLDEQLREQVRPWAVGAEGERLVAREIDGLLRRDPRWRVLHAVPIGTAGSDIDHVLIGPGGVFSINAKHHRGKAIWVAGSTFLVNGAHQPYIRNARHEAERASRLLSRACGFPVRVRAIIVPVNARSFTIREAPGDVDVINRQRLVPWIRRYVEQLPMPVVDELFAVARRSSTWA